MDEMKCPFCKRPLVRGELKRYETIVDHGFNPNATEYPLRPTWVCGCQLSQGRFWDGYGDSYGGDYASYSELKAKYGDPADEYHSLHAIGGGAWKWVRERNREKWLNTFAIYRWWRKWRWNRLARKCGWVVGNRG